MTWVRLRGLPTSRGVLSEARHLVLPSGIVSSGFPAVEATCRQIGIEFDPWQRDLNRAILAKDRHGFYAADTIVMSICRQAGKTFDIGALVFADSIIHPGTTTVWTAHRFKVSRETFNELRALARSPRLAPHIDYDEITTGAGNETIPFRNGSRIVFAARERGAIRGFTKVRRLILDEGQILTEAAMSDLAPTMNQAENPQIIIMGTPPKPSDPSEVFASMRRSALDGESDGVLYVEFSADPDADLDDWSAVARANPSFPHRTSKRAILRLRKLLTNDDDYRREALGIWDAEGLVDVFGMGKWRAGATEESSPVPPSGLAVATTLDGSFSTIGAAAVDDGTVYVKPLQHGPGTAWVVDAAKGFQERYGADVVIDDGGPAAGLIADLEGAGVRLRAVKMPDVLAACAWFFERVVDGDVRHGSFPELDRAVSGAKKRDVGDRGWAWGRKKSTADVSPLEAVTLAAWGARQEPVGVSAYESRGVLTV